ncbi:MAG TPA: hypothetical protein VFP98_06010 [Candidatus Polarisedimenticolia bacterium]|nr:hypothetical protein [Candidatus Polarisedimenticolia bacterium]
MELKDLAKMTVTQLREEARKFEDIKGTMGMSKEQLIDTLCDKLNIAKKKALPKGIGRHALKEKIRKLRGAREQVFGGGDRKSIHKYRRRLKSLRRRLRKVIEKAARGKLKGVGEAPKQESA